MFTAALFTIAKTWKQAKYPSTKEWERRCSVCVCMCVCVHAMENYPVIEKNEIMPFAFGATWMYLEIQS